MKDLVIYGTSTLAKLANYYATQELGYKVVAFVVDEDYRTQPKFLNLPVLTWPEFLATYSVIDVCIHVAVGYKSIRARAAIYDRVKARGYELINIVSTASYLANDVKLGDNNFVMPGVVVETGVTFNSNNIIWSNATICHDTGIGSHNFIAANTAIGGCVKIGDSSFLGFSSVVLQNLEIGTGVLVGAHSLVTLKVEDLSKVQGSPARIVGRIEAARGVEVD